MSSARWLVPVLGAVVFGVTFAAAHRVLSRVQVAQPPGPGWRVLLLDPEPLGRRMEVAGPAAGLIASAGATGMRIDPASGRREYLAVLAVEAGAGGRASLTQSSTTGTAWAELGRIEWSAPGDVSFVYASGDEPFPGYRVRVTFDAR